LILILVLLSRILRPVRRDLPGWVTHLEDEDLQFVKRLVLASGSLKDLAAAYGVSYPTIRTRLDRLIERIRLVDAIPADDRLVARIRILVAEGRLSSELGKELLALHRAQSRDEARSHEKGDDR
jgi:hypothetical protein